MKSVYGNHETGTANNISAYPGKLATMQLLLLAVPMCVEGPELQQPGSANLSPHTTGKPSLLLSILVFENRADQDQVRVGRRQHPLPIIRHVNVRDGRPQTRERGLGLHKSRMHKTSDNVITPSECPLTIF